METKEINMARLKKGDVISFYNDNQNPELGSIGPSEQHLRYLGDNIFEVIKSTRSLEPGMRVAIRKQVFGISEQVDLLVLESESVKLKKLQGKSLLFRMRPIKRIQISNS